MLLPTFLPHTWIVPVLVLAVSKNGMWEDTSGTKAVNHNHQYLTTPLHAKPVTLQPLTGATEVNGVS